MIIREIRVRNFRPIKDDALPCEKLTAIVGPNSAGKSSFLHALRLFYTPGAHYGEDDFYNHQTNEPISIVVTFSELSNLERELFEPYLDGETLTIEKELTYPRGKGSEKYYGQRLRHPGFQEVRSVARALEKRSLYNQLREAGYDLPPVSRAEDIEPNLLKWEQEHIDECQRLRDDGQFFGFKEVGTSRLERFTRLLFVPAVRDASVDATEGRGSVLTDLMDLVVRSTLSKRKEFKAFQEETQARYKELTDPSNLPELCALQSAMTQTLSTFVPNTGVELNWQTSDTIEVPTPRANVKLVEDGFSAPVDRTGHGLQRAFIFTLLQHLAFAQDHSSEEAITGNEDVSRESEEINSSGTLNSSLILVIEEPELYQHPSRQRYLSKILLRLATDGIQGVTKDVQVLYCTHSPLFVDIERFDQIWVVRKEFAGDDLPKQTKVRYTSLGSVANVLHSAQDTPLVPFSAETLKPRLATLLTPHKNEGFFADVVVLVEGETDRAVITGSALANNVDFDHLGICVIPCSKNGLDRPFVIFSELGIPVYMVWDGDHGGENAEQSIKCNRALLRLLQEDPEDWPEGIHPRYACFRHNLETQLKNELGEDIFIELVEKYKMHFGYSKRKDTIKNPMLISRVIQDARERGLKCRSIEQILNFILELARD